MEIFLQTLLLIAGFILLIKGADFLVDGSSSIASNFKVSKLLIGLTIVAFGTGAPELAVSFSSLINGSTDILVGNVLGSNIINVLLLIGIAAIIRPIKVKKDTVSKELPLLLLISTALIILLLDVNLSEAVINTFSRADAIICLLFFCIFLYYLFSLARKNKKESAKILSDKTYTEEQKRILLSNLAAQFNIKRTLNIIEEPEQNLFPTSQQGMLYKLLEFNNRSKDNKLIITTHSPYIIGYMTLAVKAMELYKKAKKEEVRAQINEIVPQKSAISHDDLVIYELDEKDGSIHKLDTYKGIPSSKNYLNSELSEKNELYAQLLDIEDLCR